MERWQVEVSVENMQNVDPHIINLLETSEEESNLDDWPVTLE